MATMKPLEEIKKVEVKNETSLINPTYIKVGNSLVYSDELFESIKEVLMKDKTASMRGIKWSQPNNGNKIIFYQGNMSNVWGYIESIFENDIFIQHNIKLYNSLLRMIFKQNELTKGFFSKIV